MLTLDHISGYSETFRESGKCASEVSQHLQLSAPSGSHYESSSKRSIETAINRDG